MKLFQIFTVVLIFISQVSFSQEHTPVQNPPILVETMAGNRGIFVQGMVSKKFQSIPKLGFFSVNNIVGEWNKNQVDDLMLQAHLTYEFYKGITLNTGFHYTPMTGIRPMAGIMYSWVNPVWTVVLFPRTDLTSKPNVEMFGLTEYKPKINEKLTFYSRVQGMYAYNPDMEAHQKSGIGLRAGISFKVFTVGAAYNSDWYGPNKVNIDNIGGFVTFLLF